MAIEFDKVPCPVKGLRGMCHIFKGHKDRLGYGKARNKSGSTLVHVQAWEAKNGPVPRGLEIDHRCKVRACCNAWHLRAVTHKINCESNGGHYRSRTVCKNDHSFNGDNLVMEGPKRRCRACKRAWSRKHYWKTGKEKRRARSRLRSIN